MSSSSGFSSLVAFMGRVEEGDAKEGIDLQKYGRVKVRCFGFHSPSKTELPTSELPWAIPVAGSHSSKNYKPPSSGTLVFGLFLDGNAAQNPVILGSVPAMNIRLTDGDDGYAPELNSRNLDNYFRPDTSLLSRGENIEQTGVFVKAATRKKGVETSTGESWDENPPAYFAKYPYNHAWETDSGHVLELDDTPGAERIHFYHKSGAYIEIDSNGTIVTKTKGNCQTIIDRNEYVSVSGSSNVTIEKASNVYVMGDANLKVNGNMKTTIHGDYDLSVGGNMSINVGNTLRSKFASGIFEAFSDNLSFFSAKDMRTKTGGMFSVNSGKSVILASSESASISGNAATYISGSSINLNASKVLAREVEVSGEVVTGSIKALTSSTGGPGASPSSFGEAQPKALLTGLGDAPINKIITRNELPSLVPISIVMEDDIEVEA